MLAHRILDLFAGAGGWSAAARDLGVDEWGVENWRPALDTRIVNGFHTLYTDAWDLHQAEELAFDTLIASPPCQTFSVAGNNAGTRALGDVLGAIYLGAFRSIEALRAHTAALDDERTGLVLLPLAYAYQYRPDYIALEQVQAVAPVWEHFAEQLNKIGYYTWTGILRAEEYGVPQTRRRAILMARRTPFDLPQATHAAFKKGDPALPKTRSIESALHLGQDYQLKSNYSAYGPNGATAEERGRSYRTADEPSHVITSKPHSFEFSDGTRRTMTPKEAAALQGFREEMIWPERVRLARQMIGNAVPPPMAKSILTALWKESDNG